MKLLLLVSAILLLTGIPVFAQSVDTAWVRRYNGPGNNSDGAQGIAIDGSGNVYVTGYSFGSGTYFDYATIKYYPNGDTAWVRRYNGPGNSDDESQAIAVDGSGNVYVTGAPFMGADDDYATIKYYPNGDTAWVRTYNGPGNSEDYPFAIALDDSGNVYVAGGSRGTSTDYDYATIKYYPSGETAWARRYNGPGNYTDVAFAISVDGLGNVYVTGQSDYDTLLKIADYATIKYYPNGDTAWVRTYDGPGNDFDAASAIAADGSGNVYVTGWSWGGYETDHEYATIKYYPNGDTAWVRRYDGPGNHFDRAYAIAIDSSGNVYVTGYSNQNAGLPANYDYATIKYYPNGDTAWVRRYHGLGDSIDVATAIAVDSCGNTYVTGYSWSGTDYDYATIKYDSSGNELWVETYNGSGNGDDKARAIAVCGCDTVYVTGESHGSGTDRDYVTIKYVQKETSIQEEKDQTTVHSFALHQNYPNPFNPETKIQYCLPEPTSVSLNIYNIMGQKVKVLVDECQTSGTKSVTWDGKDNWGRIVASGIYFYRLETTDYAESKKMLLLR